VPVTVGAALAFKRRGEARVALTFFGDGAMSTGDVHEGLNLAAVWGVPAVFVVQANEYAYSTPTARQTANTNLSERMEGGWRIPCRRVDGTDAVAVFETVRDAIERARAGEGPQAVEALTLRGHGHAAHDDARYVPQELRDRYPDPVERLGRGLGREEAERVGRSVEQEVAEGLAEAEASPAPDPTTLLDGVYANPVQPAKERSHG
jgi:TPP-dependent pyruvate/acetoin dehydrogenase alpha subunit